MAAKKPSAAPKSAPKKNASSKESSSKKSENSEYPPDHPRDADGHFLIL